MTDLTENEGWGKKGEAVIVNIEILGQNTLCCLPVEIEITIMKVGSSVCSFTSKQ